MKSCTVKRKAKPSTAFRFNRARKRWLIRAEPSISDWLE